MVEYEHNTLVLDSSHSKEDQEAINNFISQKITEAIFADNIRRIIKIP